MERIFSDIASGENILRNLRHVRENEIKICPIFDSIFDGIDLINQANIKGNKECSSCINYNELIIRSTILGTFVINVRSYYVRAT